MLARLSAPINVFLNLTNACNLRCLYCSSDSGHPSTGELTHSEWARVIDELGELKVFTATLTGGEPLVRRDFFDLAKRLLENRIQARLISNGTLLRPDTVERLVAVGLRTVSVSLDGASAGVNDATRGEGAFDRALAGVHSLLNAGIRPTILVTVTRLNMAQVAEIVQTLAGLDVQAIALNLVSEIGRETRHQNQLGLRLRDLTELTARIRDAQSSHPDLVKEELLHWFRLPQLLERHGLQQTEARLLPCGAARTSCVITADGWVVPCNKLSAYRCGDIRSKSLAEIWRGAMMQRIRDLAQIPTAEAPGCSTCRYSSICFGGCRAEAYLRFGELLAPDPHCSVLTDSGIHGYS